MFGILDSDIINNPEKFKPIILNIITKTRDIDQRYLALVKYTNHFCKDVNDIIIFVKDNKIFNINYYYHILDNTSKFSIFGKSNFNLIVKLSYEYCIEKDYKILLDKYRSEGVIIDHSTKFMILSLFYLYCRVQILIAILYLILRFDYISIAVLMISIMNIESMVHSINFIYLFFAKYIL